MRRLALVLLLTGIAAPARADDDLAACECDVTPAACDASCACDLECAYDWSVDECAQPGADCEPEGTLDATRLEADEVATPEDTDPVVWTAAKDAVSCPDGATNQDGTCVADPGSDLVTGGCAVGATPGILIALALVLIARRRKLLVVTILAACAMDTGGWDDSVDAGPTGDAHAYIDVYAADLGDGDAAQFVLANQAITSAAQQPVAQFSLLRAKDDVPIFRVPSPAGDRLVTAPAPGAQLLGWAHAGDGDGAAPLVELATPDGGYAYETDPEAVDARVAEGYTITGTLGHVWPPGLGDVVPSDDAMTAFATPATCKVTKSSAVQLLYASPGADESLRFLIGCMGEVIIGEKNEDGPHGAMRTAAARAAGGRTAFVLDRNGDKLRALLNRTNGVERTVQYLKHKLASGYDYIVIDEITAAPDFRDGTALNLEIRKLMMRMPARTIIPYISIDLTEYPNGLADLKARRLLLRSFKRRARALALEVYLHTGQVMAGAAPATFRRAADRIALAVRGLAGTAGINRRAITTIGTSMHSKYPQYRYLDQPAHDLAALTREVNAIRLGSKRLRSQHGIGWYFVNRSDMQPSGTYSYDALIRRMRLQALRFK